MIWTFAFYSILKEKEKEKIFFISVKTKKVFFQIT